MLTKTCLVIKNVVTVYICLFLKCLFELPSYKKNYGVKTQERKLQKCTHAHREILLDQTQIRLYIYAPIDLELNGRLFGSKISWKMINTILFRFDLIRFRKVFSVRRPDRCLFSSHCTFICSAHKQTNERTNEQMNKRTNKHIN